MVRELAPGGSEAGEGGRGTALCPSWGGETGGHHPPVSWEREGSSPFSGHRGQQRAFLVRETPSLTCSQHPSSVGTADLLIPLSCLILGGCVSAFQALEGGLGDWGSVLPGLLIPVCKSSYFPVSLLFFLLSPRYDSFAPL